MKSRKPRREPCPIAVGAAEGLLQACGVRSPRDIRLERLAERRGAYVLSRPLFPYDARILFGLGAEALIFVDSDVIHTPRGRFLIAHELGHWVLHRGADLVATCRGEDPGPTLRFANERQANDYAVALTMPPFLARPHCDAERPRLADVRMFAEAFAVSLTAAGLRYTELTDAPCAWVMVEDGIVKWSAESATFPIHITRRFRLHSQARASSRESLDWHVAGGRPEIVHADAWSRDKDARGMDLFEHAMRAGERAALVWLTPA